MSTIVLIGGHGRVALLAEPLLVAAGHTVRAVIRNAEHTADVAATGAEPVIADVESLDADGIAALLTGADVLIWSAGAGGGDPARTYAVDRDAAIASMTAAERAGVRRYVMVSYFGAGPDHGVEPGASFFPYADAKTIADAHLAGTSLDWTILRPSLLTFDPPTGTIEVNDGSVDKGAVPRGDVAAVIAATVDAPQTIRRVIEFNGGPTPIVDALA